MKRIVFTIILIISLALIYVGCTKENEPTNHQEGELVLVNLNLTGEISVEETPLTKALTSEDLIGVQVYQGSDYYAYGLFDDVSKMNLYLNSGQTYKFVCSVVKNGKNVVYQSTESSARNWRPYYPSASYTNKVLEYSAGEYLLPFVVTSGGSDYYSCPISNHFNYGKLHFSHLDKGLALTIAYLISYVRYQMSDRFYGEVSGFTAAGNGSLSIPLKRVSFGLSLSVTGITDGSVSVTIKNDNQTFLSNTGISQDTQFDTTCWSFYDLKSAWQYADNYAESFTVGVVWNRSVGVTQDLGSKTVQFKRNAVNRVNVNLGSATKSAGLAISVEEPEITTETYTVGN